MPPERLIDVLWGEDPPATAAKALQVHVSRLRHALGPGDPIVTRASGYAVALEPGALDLERFETLVARARAARESGRLPRPPGCCARRSRCSAGRRSPTRRCSGRRRTSRAGSRRLRLAVLEERIDADVALGGHAALVGELEALDGRASRTASGCTRS